MARGCPRFSNAKTRIYMVFCCVILVFCHLDRRERSHWKFLNENRQCLSIYECDFSFVEMTNRRANQSIARWHVDAPDSLMRKRGFMDFFVVLLAFFVISTEGRDHTGNSSTRIVNLCRLTSVISPASK